MKKRILTTVFLSVLLLSGLALAQMDPYHSNHGGGGGTMTTAQLNSALWTAPYDLGTITTGFTVSHQDTYAVLTAGDAYTITMGGGVTGRSQIVRLITPPSGATPTLAFSGNANSTFAVSLAGYAANQEVDLLIGYDGTNYTASLGTLAPGPGVVQVDANSNIQTGQSTITKTTATAYTVGTTDARESYGGAVFVTGSATIAFPAAKSGMHVLIVTKGAYTVKIAPASGEQIDLNGTDLTANYIATNTSTTGDVAACTYEASGKWFCHAASWTGGAS